MKQVDRTTVEPGECERLRQLVEASRMLNASLDLDQILAKMLEIASSLLPADRTTLFLADEERQELWSRAAQQSGEIRIPIGSGIAGHVASTGEALITRDAYELPFFNRAVDRENGFRTRSVLCVPLRDREGRVIGVLQTLNKKSGHFTDEDCRFLEDLGIQAATAIGNALLHQERLKQQVLERDLTIAARIQKDLLRHPSPGIPGLDIEAYSQPARHVGGDFYEYFRTDRDSFLLALGDVSGKGIPAALMMSNILACLRTLAPFPLAPDELLDRLDRFLGERSLDLFCTAFLGELDLATRRLRYSCAGHPPALLCRRSGPIMHLGEGGLPLGVMPGTGFQSATAQLGPGDILVLYSDGLLEAKDPSGALYGPGRLSDLLQRSHHLPAREILSAILVDLEAFVRGAPRSDDLTLLILAVA